MACTCQTAQELLPALTTLQQSVQEHAEEAISFRKWNASRFDKRNETTQLLNTAAEQLWNEKQAMEQANFEEHASELPYLCQHFRTVIDQGVAENVYAEKYSQLQAKKKSAGLIVEAKPRRLFSCCSSDFPPQQGWWQDTSRRLVPKFEVLRGGRLILSAAADLVTGDIIYACAGQLAVADARVLVTADVTAIDVSHLTSRPNDVRICSSRTSSASVLESRNIVLKDSHIVSGALFCMVVRTPLEPFVTATASAGQDSIESSIDTAVPTSLTLGSCQTLFKSLCVKASLFCKGFKVIEYISSCYYVMIMLTQEMLDKGTVPSFCSVASNLKKSVIFVSCSCDDASLKGLCQSLGITGIDFEDHEAPCPPSKPSKGQEDGIEIASTTSIDLGLCAAAMGNECVGDYEQGKLSALLDQLQAGSPITAVVNGISQAALLKMCKQLCSGNKVMLYVMSEFHYSKCFRSLAVETTAKVHRILPSVMGHSEASTGIAENSLAASPYDPVSPPAKKSHKSPARCTSEAEMGTLSKHTASFSCMESTRTDPAPHFNVRLPTGTTPSHAQERRGDQVFVSVNSLGIVSEYSDCILLKPDLGCLGNALEIIGKKFGR